MMIVIAVSVIVSIIDILLGKFVLFGREQSDEESEGWMRLMFE